MDTPDHIDRAPPGENAPTPPLPDAAELTTGVDEPEAATEKQFPCASCGATLQYLPGTSDLQCPYCGGANHIPQSEEEIEELDFHAHIEAQVADAEHMDARVIKCDACGAEAMYPEHAAAVECAFCGFDIVATATSLRIIKPRSLLPFHVDRAQSRDLFRRWLASRWFAPTELKKRAAIDNKLVGMYVPYWTYDAKTTTFYTGKRGDNYTVRRRDSQGRMRSETRTRWRSASGTVWNTFDDILVIGSTSLPHKHIAKLGPWDLENLVPYTDEYLSGFLAESYTVDLEAGFESAKRQMDPTIDMTIRSDIGGDHQRISSKNVQYDDIRFKHILLPIWISTYRYNGKPYRFLVNARTGELQGERPYSGWKIAFLVAAIALAILVITVLFVVVKATA